MVLCNILDNNITAIVRTHSHAPTLHTSLTQICVIQFLQQNKNIIPSCERFGIYKFIFVDESCLHMFFADLIPCLIHMVFRQRKTESRLSLPSSFWNSFFLQNESFCCNKNTTSFLLSFLFFQKTLNILRVWFYEPYIIIL
jgi:hypothetical protein